MKKSRRTYVWSEMLKWAADRCNPILFQVWGESVEPPPSKMYLHYTHILDFLQHTELWSSSLKTLEGTDPIESDNLPRRVSPVFHGRDIKWVIIIFSFLICIKGFLSCSWQLRSSVSLQAGHPCVTQIWQRVKQEAGGGDLRPLPDFPSPAFLGTIPPSLSPFSGFSPLIS